ncbi:MAG: DMT family transporter [Lachnospiraceae bacterium]|nr:DMT family transporter [Lachnospiraceae bacterium]
MKNKQLSHSLILAFAALIWGVAFVAQSKGGESIGAFSFNGIRMTLGGLVLLPVIAFLDKNGLSSKKPATKEEKKILLIGGLLCGLALIVASNFQQVAINLGAEAGKAGFLTACYILMVPILGIFFKRKCGINIWIAVMIALVGLYLLCLSENLTIKLPDLLLLLCAFSFSVHILLVEKFAPAVDGVRLSAIQFFTCGIVTTFISVFTEMKPWDSASLNLWISSFAQIDAWGSILYAGVLSSGVAYTLQIIGQEGLNSTVASLVMSLESVFAVLAGWIILGQTLSPREFAGCGLIFSAIILAQLPKTMFTRDYSMHNKSHQPET